MFTNIMINLSLISLKFYLVEGFSILNRNQPTKKIHDFRLFGTSATTTIDTYRSKTNGRGDEAKLFFQNPKEFNVWIEDETVKVEDSSHTKTTSSSQADYHKSILKMKSLAQAGRSLVNELRSTATSVDNGICYINQLNKEECHDYDTIREKYEITLKQARDTDLKYGLCSAESLQAWDTADEIYRKLERYGDVEEERCNDEIRDIFEACDLLDTAFIELQEKMN